MINHFHLAVREAQKNQSQIFWNLTYLSLFILNGFKLTSEQSEVKKITKIMNFTLPSKYQSRKLIFAGFGTGRLNYCNSK